MKEKYISLFKDTTIFAIGSIGSRMILFLLVPLYTNCLTTDEYGIAELLFTISELLIPFLTMTIQDALIRFGFVETIDKNSVIKNCYLVWVISIVLTILLLPLIAIDKSLAPWKWYVFVYIISRSLSAIQLNYLKVVNQNRLFALFSIIQTLTLATMNLIFLLIFNMGIKGYLTANILGFVVSNIGAFFASKTLKALRKGHIDFKLLKEMLKFSAPMILTNISWWIVNSSSKIILQWKLGVAALGLFTVATKIPSLINVITNIFTQAWNISSIKEIEGSDDHTFYATVFSKFTFLVFAMCLFLNCIMKKFMTIYVGESYFSAWSFVPLLLVSATASAIVSFTGSIFLAMKKTVFSMTTTVIGSFINIVVNFSLVDTLGIWSAVISTLLSYTVVAILRMSIVEKHIKLTSNMVNLILNSLIVFIHALLICLEIGSSLIVSCVCLICFVSINYKSFEEMICLIKTMLGKKAR